MTRSAALALLLCSCAHGAPAPVEGAPMRKGDPEPVFEFEAGPVVTDTAAVAAWLEENRERRLRVPVVLELAPVRGIERARVGEVDLRVSDLALGIPLVERAAHACGRDATRCALWLEGRYGDDPLFEGGPPQLAVLKVGEVVDEAAELRVHRAR